jgi:hypothetical protein
LPSHSTDSLPFYRIRWFIYRHHNIPLPFPLVPDESSPNRCAFYSLQKQSEKCSPHLCLIIRSGLFSLPFPMKHTQYLLQVRCKGHRVKQCIISTPLTWKGLKALNLPHHRHLTRCVTERRRAPMANKNRRTGTDALHPSNCMPDSRQGNRSAMPIRPLHAIRQSLRFAPRSLTEIV